MKLTTTIGSTMVINGFPGLLVLGVVDIIVVEDDIDEVGILAVVDSEEVVFDFRFVTCTDISDWFIVT